MACSKKIIIALALVVGLAGCAREEGSVKDLPLKRDVPAELLVENPPEFSILLSDRDKLALARRILDLGPGVDPEEAARAADIAYDYTAELREEYQITDPPLIHNFKVNRGIKPRGLCWHWAEDMERRLKRENFQTLSLHRAIANHDNVRIDHSTAIVSAAGSTMFDGIVLDPWRKGGVLSWMPVAEDRRYDWRPRAEVLQFYRNREAGTIRSQN